MIWCSLLPWSQIKEAMAKRFILLILLKIEMIVKRREVKRLLCSKKKSLLLNWHRKLHMYFLTEETISYLSDI